MTVRKVRSYDIVCDARDCDFDSADLGDDYSIWVDEDQAEEQWIDHDCQRTAEGKHYCPKHINPACQYGPCEVTKGLIRITADGDLFCLTHAPSAVQG